MSKVLIFISENASKFKELENCINNIRATRDTNQSDNLVFQMIKPDGELHEIQSLDRNEIIIHKLKTACDMVKNMIQPNSECWIMVEDTSFCIEKERGFPGPFVKYYLQVNSLADIANKNWASQAQSIVTFGICKFTSGCDSLDIHVFEDSVNGYIVLPSGVNGFGYDSIFKPIGSNKTNADMNMNEKANFNPRINAFTKVINYIC
jgi:non-canonical purine NTP pyrophosphatase (RdgB/HAM1 family)